MHKAAATQSQRPTCGPPDAHRVSTVHPTRSWRREDRSHSQLWPHITACEMPTVRATTPPRSARRHSQRRRGALDAPTSEAYKGPGRAARRAPNGQGRRGGPYTRGPPPPQRGRHRVDDSGANGAQLWGTHPHQDAQLRSTRRNPSSQALEQLRFYGGQRNIIHQSKRSRLRPRSTPALGRLSSASTPLPLFKIAPTTIPTLPPRPPWAAIDTTGFDAGPRGDGRAADGHEPRRG